MLKSVADRKVGEILLRLTAAVLLGIWLLLILFGKGGFAHILLLCGLVIVIIEFVGAYRMKITK